MHRLYANTIPFYIRDLSIEDFGVPGWGGGHLGTNSPWILRDNCILFNDSAVYKTFKSVQIEFHSPYI